MEKRTVRRRTWDNLTDLSEEELRRQIILPLLAATDGLHSIQDVHGLNEKGLDVIFYERGAIEDLCYGLQLKKGNISGGGTSEGVVSDIITQLGIASDLSHPVAVEGNGKVQIDRFIVATSGRISGTARDEIASRLKKIPVTYWDGTAIERRIRQSIPELFSAADGAVVAYLRATMEEYDQLDALDQIPGVAKRTLTQVYEEPTLRRRFAVPFQVSSEPAKSFAPEEEEKKKQAPGAVLTVVQAQRLPALQLAETTEPTVIIGDQDAGKTALLRMIALQRGGALLKGSVGSELKGVPVLIRAKDIVAKNLSCLAAVQAELKNNSGDPLAESLEDDLKAGMYLLLIDGFSELSSQEFKENVFAAIEGFRKEYPQTKIIVSGRPADFLRPHFFDSYTQYFIEEFDQRQVSSLLNKWTSDSPGLADVARSLSKRIREALQLPGSPISATIGVMLYEEERRYITNTAEAVDRYMVIRLGRYSHELGVKQEIEWTRKLDILGEIALEMVDTDTDQLPTAAFLDKVNAVFEKLGEKHRGDVVIAELLESGVLSEDDRGLFFHRTAFRDFFAAHAINQLPNPNEFIRTHLVDKKWGLALAFAAGLKRKNTELLEILTAEVKSIRKNAIGAPSSDYFYAAYLLGRILSNSETAQESARLEVLRELLAALQMSLPEFVEAAKAQFGNIGEIAALIGTEHTFFATVGVPWLENQFELLAHDPALSEEQRYFSAGTHLHLGCGHGLDLIDVVASNTGDTRVLLALKVLVEQVMRERNLNGKQRDAYKVVMRKINRRLARPERKREARELTQIRSKILKLETQRLNRLIREKKR